MRCFFCENEATAKIFTNIDGCKQEIDVCEMHIEELKKFNFEQFCENFLNIFKGPQGHELFQGTSLFKAAQPKNTSWEHLVKCPECFKIFQKSIVPMLQDVHAKHHVKRNTAPLYRMRRDLEVAVKEERYEDAAKIRDAIKKHEETNGKK